MTFPSPQYHAQEEYQNRLRKLEELKALGIDPYPHSYVNTKKAQAVAIAAEGKEVGLYEEAAGGKTERVFLSGRLVLFRPMGKNIFAQIQDETGRIQVLFNREETQLSGFKAHAEWTVLKILEKKLDLGDILGVEGYLFRTNKGELTVFVHRVTLLSKSLLPLPDKHSGMSDKGVLYRKRWLDLIIHPESMERFRLRSRILFSIRKYFEHHDFEEVETPILQPLYGGAEARPFSTHLNALHQDMFLRIALEINLKKLIVGGMQRVFEIGKVFRNEGIDRTHNPEFTMVEAYAAGWDYSDMLLFTEKLFEKIALELFGETKFLAATGQEIDLKTPWRQMTMKESIREYATLDVDKMKDLEMKAHLKTHSSLDPQEVDRAPRGILIGMLFSELVEKHLIQPHHILDHPIETTPFCKLHRDPGLKQERFVERFESFILGTEFCNSYSELNDPILQRELLLLQAEAKMKGKQDASPLDEEFLEAICQGMPPAGGVGIGIDRLVMLFTKAPSIRDVLFFPLMRPEESQR